MNQHKHNEGAMNLPEEAIPESIELWMLDGSFPLNIIGARKNYPSRGTEILREDQTPTATILLFNLTTKSCS